MARVLIVEDSATQAERLQLTLADGGYESVIAGDAVAAIEALLAAPFDLVISDIVMPGESGYDLCRRIKAHSEWRAMPVVLLTTRRDPMDIFKGLECGADNFYTKPYEPDRLLERVRNILHNRQLRAEGKLRLGVEVSMFGKTFTIGADRGQILDMLISTFEDIVETNVALEKTRDALKNANAKLDRYVRRLEDRVQSSEDLYQAVFENITDGLVLLDPDYVITSANPAARRMFAASGREDLVDMDLRTLLAPSPGAPDTDPVPQPETGGRHLGRRFNGASFPLAMAISEPMRDQQRVRVALMHDLTAEQAAQERLAQAQKMESVGQLTGGVAHDFNNLLTVIMGNTDVLLDRFGNDAELGPAVAMIAAAAQRGAEMTHRLLAFGRRQSLEAKPTDVNDLVGSLGSLLRRTLGEDIEIAHRLAAGLPPVLVDPGQLESALLNLCLNARDAMAPGGRLTLETAAIALDEDYTSRHADLRPGAYVMLAVSDTGTGVAPAHLHRVFEPYFTTKPVGKGTGLGLSMVYGFLKQSDGHVSIYSEPGEGTTVKLYLPVTSNAQIASRGEVAPARPKRGAEAILLVEDDELVRQYAKQQLESLGYQVFAAPDGPAALQILKSEARIDLLFTDIVMPGGMNGRQLADAAAAIRPELKVLYTSGYTENAILHHGRLDPGVRLLNKPYRRVDLARIVRDALDEPPAAAGGARE